MLVMLWLCNVHASCSRDGVVDAMPCHAQAICMQMQDEFNTTISSQIIVSFVFRLLRNQDDNLSFVSGFKAESFRVSITTGPEHRSMRIRDKLSPNVAARSRVHASR